MEEIYGIVEDVSNYSLPVRDILPVGGGVIVLRNREDILRHDGGLELWKGRRADRYDDKGKQSATAVFDRPVNWIVSVTNAAVIGVSTRGDVAVARFAKAMPGLVIPK
jgi:hypothetical protein